MGLTTSSTQTVELCSSCSTKPKKCNGCSKCCSGPDGRPGDQGQENEKQESHCNTTLASHEQRPRKLCNHDHDQENFSASEVSDPGAGSTDLVEQPASMSSVGEVATADVPSAGMMHPHHQHHHHHHRHQQPQRPQRISFRKEGQPPTPNQQNRSNRNTVAGDSSKVTIIVAKDSGDVLL